MFRFITYFCLFVSLPYSILGKSTGLFANPIIIDEIIHTQELCNLSNATITIIINNPEPSTIYSIDNGISFQSSNFFGNLPSGDYLIVVANANNCSQTVSVQIVNAPEPKITLDIECIEGLNKVNINMTPFQTGIFPFTYEWLDETGHRYRNQDLLNVDPGMYSVTVTDRLGCQIDSSFLVEKCCDISFSCMSDTFYLECVGELEDISPKFLDAISVKDEDRFELLNLGIHVLENCDSFYVQASDFNLTPIDCNNGSMMVDRTIIAYDGIDSAICHQIFYIEKYEQINIIEDPIDLEISCSQNIDSLFNDWITNHGYIQLDNCDDHYNIITFPDQPLINYTCPLDGETEVEFLVYDECGVEHRTLAKFSIKDNQAPVIDCPEAITLDLWKDDYETQIELWLNMTSASDNCSQVSVTNNYIPQDWKPLCEDQQLSINFNAQDECANQSSCESEIFLIHSYSPELNCPPNLLLTCSNENHQTEIQNWMDQAYAEFNGLPIDINIETEYNSSFVFGCDDEIPVLFTLNEICSENYSCLSHIIVQDNQAPDLQCPDDISINADELAIDMMISDWLSSASFSDNCQSVNLENSYSPLDWNSVCSNTDIKVIFIARDICNNSSQCLSTAHIIYDFSPTLECPDDLLVNCINSINASDIDDWIDSAVAYNENNSLDIQVSTNYSSFEALSCNEVINFTFSVIDNCPIDLKCERQIIISDNTSPTIQCPTVLTVDNRDTDIDLIIAQWLDSATSVDNCNLVIVENDFVQEDWNSFCNDQSRTISFFSIDDCANDILCQAQMEVIYSFSPELICPNDTIVSCIKELNLSVIDNWTSSAMAQLNNEPISLSISSNFTTIESLSCNDEIWYEFEVIDDCITDLNCRSTLKINDSIAPTITCPPSLTVDNRDPNINETINDWLTSAMSVDNCDLVSVQNDFVSEDWASYCNDQLRIVNFNSTDDCNNNVLCQAQMEVIYSFSPELICPNDTIVTCIKELTALDIYNWSNSAYALLDNQPLTFNSSTNFSTLEELKCDDEIWYEFEVIDECITDLSCRSTLKINDTDSPTIICPPTLSVDNRDPAINDVILDWLSQASSTDNCDLVMTQNDFTAEDWSQFCDNQTRTISFSSTDDCENISMCQAQMNILFSFAPQLFCPNDTVVTCLNNFNLSIIDDWSSDAYAVQGNELISIESYYSFTSLDDLTCNDEILFTFEVNDQCISDLNCTRKIIIRDTISPVIICPSALTVANDDVFLETTIQEWISTAYAIDDCNSLTIEQNYQPEDWYSYCEDKEVVVEFSCIDDCSNSNQCTSTIYFQHNFSPILNCPENLIIDCSKSDNYNLIDSWLLSFNATSNGSDLSLVIDTDFQVGQSLDCDASFTFNVFVDDICSQGLSCSRTIIAEDHIYPNVVCPPDLIINTLETNAFEKISSWSESFMSTDNCEVENSYNNLDLGQFDQLCEIDNPIEVIFSAFDACGNGSECLSQIVVEQVNIVLTCPQPIVIECNSNDLNNVINEWIETSSAIDNFENNYSVTNDFNFGMLSDFCNYLTEVKFDVKDVCSIEYSCVSHITIQDTEAPILNCPDSHYINIRESDASSEILLWLSSVAAFDNCHDYTIANDFDADINDIDCYKEINVLFEATDECDNKSRCNSVLALENPGGISIVCPEPLYTIPCYDIPQGEISEFLASVEVTSLYDYQISNSLIFSDINTECEESFALSVLFEATDICGNANQCESQLNFMPEAKIYIPNVFSPDGDRLNDIFTIYGNESVDYVESLMIYDRWGSLIFKNEKFEINDEASGWDGYINGQSINTQVVSYYCSIKDIFGNVIERSGTLQLLR